MRAHQEELNVSKERLSLIGRLIGIYREERRGNSQNCWTQKRFCKDICSTNTLKNIEAGNLARSKEVYIDLLAKFDLKLGEFPAIDKAIFELSDALYDAIEYYRVEEIISTLDKALRILDKANTYVYYSDLYDVFYDVRKHYVDKIMIDDSSVSRYKVIMNLFSPAFLDAFRLLLYPKIKAKGIGDKVKYRELTNEIGLFKSKRSFIEIHIIDYFYVMGHYKKMEDLINNLIQTYSEKKKFIRLFDVYNYAIGLFSETEFEKCMEYIDSVEKILLNINISEIKLSELYSNIASAYQFNEKYQEALDYYDKMLAIEHRNFIDAYIFMADCQNHLGKAICIPLVTEDLYLPYPIDVKLMYKYFTFDSDIPAFAKENFIIKKIAPLLTDNDYIKIFRFEILRLVKKTGHYKSSHVFELKVQQNIRG